MADTVKLEREGLIRSQKLMRLAPKSERAAALYPWMLLLGAGENHGCFEAVPAWVRSDILRNFPSITDADTAELLGLYASEGLLILYTDSKGRQLGAWTNYRGWSSSRAAVPKYEDPPNVRHDGAIWNIPVDEAGNDERPAPLTLVVTPAPTPPATRTPRAKPTTADSPDIRAVIDAYMAIWQPPRVRDAYSKGNREAAHRTLSGGYDVQTTVIAMWLAKYGPKDWYRGHNHAFEYLTRPGVIDKLISENSSLNLSVPSVLQAAHQHGLYAQLVAMGFNTDGGGSKAPESKKAGFASSENFRRLSAQLDRPAKGLDLDAAPSMDGSVQ